MLRIAEMAVADGPVAGWTDVGVRATGIGSRYAMKPLEGCEVESLDDLEAEGMAIASVLGVKMQERSKVLRGASFEYGEPVQ